MQPRFLIALFASPDGLLFDSSEGTGAAGAGGAAPAGGSAAPAGGAAAPAGGAASPAGGGAAPAGGAAGAGGGQGFSYPEDRSTWVKPDVHRRAESLVNRTATENEQLRRDIAERDRRIAALAGVKTPSPEEAESERIAAAFFALPQFSHLKGITPEFIQNVNALISNGATMVEARDHVWEQQADRFLDALDEAYATEIGADKLTPLQQRMVRAAFSASIPDQRREPDAFATFDRRYTAFDKTLIAEFMKQYAAEMLEPARRQATVPITQRRPVPRGGPSAAVTSQANKPDYSKMGSVREMLEAAEKEAEAVGR